MSFAARTKEEITQLDVKTCCQKAELAAIIKISGALRLNQKEIHVDIMTENAAIARRIFILIKGIFDVRSEVLVRKRMRLKKNNVYIVRITQDGKKILSELGLMHEGYIFAKGIQPELIKKECCRRSYLRGAFLAGGSVNHPESNSYHLEIFAPDLEHVTALVNLANTFSLNARYIERKKGFVLYIKEGEKISEFLSIIGAHNALFLFEDVRIMKDMRNSVNRLVNCETANLNKTVSASMRQIESIKRIDDHIGLENLPEKLREIAELRLENPDLSLTELGELLPSGKVSKSGVNHRMRKIDEIASKL